MKKLASKTKYFWLILAIVSKGAFAQYTYVPEKPARIGNDIAVTSVGADDEIDGKDNYFQIKVLQASGIQVHGGGDYANCPSAVDGRKKLAKYMDVSTGAKLAKIPIELSSGGALENEGSRFSAGLYLDNAEFDGASQVVVNGVSMWAASIGIEKADAKQTEVQKIKYELVTIDWHGSHPMVACRGDLPPTIKVGPDGVATVQFKKVDLGCK